MTPLMLKLVLPVVAGGLTATLATFGLVSSQTGAPSTNPAESPVLTYGDNTQ